jgi:hypothetical protein
MVHGSHKTGCVEHEIILLVTHSLQSSADPNALVPMCIPSCMCQAKPLRRQLEPCP